MRQARLRAITYMIAAVAVFSGMDALLKLLSAYYPPMEVAALRGATSLPFMLLPLLLAGRWRDLKPRRFPMHLLRGLLRWWCWAASSTRCGCCRSPTPTRCSCRRRCS